jgi:hypothetical protein
MKKLLDRVKRAFSSGSSSKGSSSHSNDSRSQDSPWSSSFVPSLHGTAGSSRYLAHDDVPEATNSDDISICTTEETEKYESLHRQEFADTRMRNFPPSSRSSVGENSMTSLAKIRIS